MDQRLRGDGGEEPAQVLVLEHQGDRLPARIPEFIRVLQVFPDAYRTDSDGVPRGVTDYERAVS